MKWLQKTDNFDKWKFSCKQEINRNKTNGKTKMHILHEIMYFFARERNHIPQHSDYQEQACWPENQVEKAYDLKGNCKVETHLK